MPKSVIYSTDVLSKDCSVYYPGPAGLLKVNTSEYHLILCARCHQAKHKVIPMCSSCFGSSHPQGILNKHQKCVQCHSIARDLNHGLMTKSSRRPSRLSAP